MVSKVLESRSGKLPSAEKIQQLSQVTPVRFDREW